MERFGSTHIGVVLAASAFFALMIAAVTAWFENNRCLTFGAPQLCVTRRSIDVGIDGWATQENIYRCRTAVDWFVLRSEQTSNSHMFGVSYAVLVSRLRH